MKVAVLTKDEALQSPNGFPSDQGGLQLVVRRIASCQ